MADGRHFKNCIAHNWAVYCPI